MAKNDSEAENLPKKANIGNPPLPRKTIYRKLRPAK